VIVAGDFHPIRTDNLNVDRAQVFVPGDALHGGGVGNDDAVVLVCPPMLRLAFELADDDEGMFFTRTVWPTGSSGPKSSFAVFEPMTATFAALRTSRSVNIEPAASFQSRIFR